MTNLAAIWRRWTITEARSSDPAAAEDDVAAVPRAVRARRDHRNRAARGWELLIALLRRLLPQRGLGRDLPARPPILAFHAGLGLLLALGSLWLASGELSSGHTEYPIRRTPLYRAQREHYRLL